MLLIFWRKKGIQKGVQNCGDVMYDSFLKFKRQIKNGENERLEADSPYVLATMHRPENTDNKNNLISIFKELDKINQKIRVVLPLHPRTKMATSKIWNSNQDPMGRTSRIFIHAFFIEFS